MEGVVSKWKKITGEKRKRTQRDLCLYRTMFRLSYRKYAITPPIILWEIGSTVTKEAARALKEISNKLNVMGYRIKVFDAYRPAAAVRHFTLWGVDDLDQRMKPFFYPDLVKQELFRRGYIASKSSHSRGSTIDLTLLDMKTGKEVDMGSPFDYFSEVSHPDYKGITKEQYENRMFLQDMMVRGGFEPYDCEWWHFTLRDEPYPDTYFDFPVLTEVLKR